MKRENCTTDVAGLDIGKRNLDLGFARSDEHRQFANKPEAFDELLACLRAHGVKRVGMEASGNYERDVRERLEKAGFEVIVHQPQDVRAFARYRRIKAKSDKIDARLIAQATENWEGIVARRDPYVVELAEMLTFYEHVSNSSKAPFLFSNILWSLDLAKPKSRLRLPISKPATSVVLFSRFMNLTLVSSGPNAHATIRGMKS